MAVELIGPGRMTSSQRLEIGAPDLRADGPRDQSLALQSLWNLSRQSQQLTAHLSLGGDIDVEGSIRTYRLLDVGRANRAQVTPGCQGSQIADRANAESV